MVSLSFLGSVLSGPLIFRREAVVLVPLVSVLLYRLFDLINDRLLTSYLGSDGV
jgi:hypothetical protein